MGAKSNLSVPEHRQVVLSLLRREEPATVIDLLRLPDDVLFPGRSFGRYWIEAAREEPERFALVLSELSHASWRVDTPVAKGDMKSIVTGDIHYIRNGDGTEEVYDLRNDPVELNDLIQTTRGAEAAAHARHIIERTLH